MELVPWAYQWNQNKQGLFSAMNVLAVQYIGLLKSQQILT